MGQGVGKKSEQVLDPKLWANKVAKTHVAFLRPEARLIVVLTELAELLEKIGAHVLDESQPLQLNRSDLIQINIKAEKLGHLSDAMIEGSASYNPKG